MVKLANTLYLLPFNYKAVVAELEYARALGARPARVESSNLSHGIRVSPYGGSPAGRQVPPPAI